MFADFDKSQQSKEGRGRMGASLLISAGIFLGLMAAIAAAVATARVVVKRQKRDLEVSFADLPPPPKRKVVKQVQPGIRKAAKRQSLKPPSEIPEETPEEADTGELAEAGDVGPLDGFTDGVQEGTGGEAPKEEEPPPPPPPPPEMPNQIVETIIRPRFVSGCRAPEIPEALHATAATIEIDVRMLISVEGQVTDASVLRSHPLIPDDLILACARAQVFEPAHLPDGTRVPYPYRRRFKFVPAGV